MFKTAVLAAIALQGSPVAADGGVAAMALHSSPRIAADAINCYEGPLTPYDHMVAGGHVINEMVGTVLDAAATSKKFYNLPDLHSQCQLECAQKQVLRAVNAVFWNCGKDVRKCWVHGKCAVADMCTIETLTGAFMSCMPKAPRDAVHQVSTQIYYNMASSGIVSYSKAFSDLIKDNPKCPEAEAAAHFDKDKFQSEIGDAYKSVLHEKDVQDKVKQVKQALLGKQVTQPKVKPIDLCQLVCLHNSMTESVVTLVGTGNDDKEEGLKALTGASRTCFPGVPRDDVKQIISQVAEIYMKQRTELYESLRLEKLGSSSLSLVYGTAAMSLAVLLAGAGAIRRRMMPGRQQRSCEVEEGLAAE